MPRLEVLCALVVAIGALALACKFPVPFAQELLFETTRSQLPPAADCERCHGEIYAEWSHSPHAGAWTSQVFRDLTAEHQAAACLGCHAPGPLGEKGEIALRGDHRDEGVTCISCHLDLHASEPLAMRGPHERTTPVDVHPLVVDALFREAELCGTCHQAALEQWRAAPDPADGSTKKICQSCHMPEVRRGIESYDPARPYSRILVALGSKVDGRQHTFSVPEKPWEHLTLSAWRHDGGLTVEVQNDIPHSLPTGGFGRRELRVRAGDVAVRLRTTLDEAIPAGETRRFELPPGDPDAVVLERFDPLNQRYERIAPAPTAEPAP